MKKACAKEGRKLRRKAGGYAHAEQYRSFKRTDKRHRTVLGIMMREVRRKLGAPGFVATNGKAGLCPTVAGLHPGGTGASEIDAKGRFA